MSPPASNSARAPAPSTNMGDMPPVWASAEALLVAVAVDVAVALADALAEALAVALELAVVLAGISGQTPSGSNAV
jgi:hypothetical protein